MKTVLKARTRPNPADFDVSFPDLGPENLAEVMDTDSRTIGGRIGVSAKEAGLHSQHIRRRQFLDGQGQANATALISRLPQPGEALHLLMSGEFTLANVLPVIQAHIGQPCHLTICTLGLNDATTDLLAAMLRAGTLASLRLAMSSYFHASDSATADRAIQTLRQCGATIAIERNHAKLQLWQPATASARYVLETSSNLRSCNCVEILTLTNDPELYAWHNRWLTRFFERNAIK
jgi:hypothetical protein